MRQYAGAMLHHLDKVEYLTTMEFPLLVAMIILFMVFTSNKSMEGQSSPNREETARLLPEACFNDTSLQGTPGNHTPERTGSGNMTQPVHGPTPQSLPEIDTRQTQSDNVAQRETPARASSPQTENVNMTELSLSWVVIGFSAGAIIAFMGLLGNNNQISNHMAIYEAGALFLVAAIFYFKDRIITTARSFWFKQHENYGSISANETEMAETRSNIDA